MMAGLHFTVCLFLLGGVLVAGSEKSLFFESEQTVEKVSVIVPELLSESVKCPDQLTQCPENNSCCKLNNGDYGCCPIPKAVCCSDGLHCCPETYTCNIAGSSCIKDGMALPLFSKIPATKIAGEPEVLVGSVKCPDGSSECPDGNTCCKLASGQYGCCPSPKAVCCSDGVHCCPSGYKCDPSSGSCSKGSDFLNWMVKRPAAQIVLKAEVSKVKCPDGKSECPSGNTCCKLSSGQYGCCPQPEAVCCSDGVHCCPHGYTCDVSAGTCSKGSDIGTWFVKRPAAKIGPKIEDENSVMCPGGTSECPPNNTCCKLKSGAWGCCPVCEAVCCTDGVHCCPPGYTCDVSGGTCKKGSDVLTWLLKKSATQIIP